MSHDDVIEGIYHNSCGCNTTAIAMHTHIEHNMNDRRELETWSHGATPQPHTHRRGSNGQCLLASETLCLWHALVQWLATPLPCG